MTFTDVGYQPVGMNPNDRLLPGCATSNTARQLLSALATSSLFWARASPLGVLPAGALGYSDVTMVSSTFRVFTSITDTALSLAQAT